MKELEQFILDQVRIAQQYTVCYAVGDEGKLYPLNDRFKVVVVDLGGGMVSLLTYHDGQLIYAQRGENAIVIDRSDNSFRLEFNGYNFVVGMNY